MGRTGIGLALEEAMGSNSRLMGRLVGVEDGDGAVRCGAVQDGREVEVIGILGTSWFIRVS